VHDPRHIDVFFYGLFMDADALRARGFNPINPRLGRVNNYALRIGQRATLVPSVGAEAYGFVMSLTHADIDRLYTDESVSVYRPDPVSVELTDTSSIPALCFNLPTAPSPGEANAAYAAKLGALCRRLGLPAAYVASIA
jgi:hypothetical protein